MDASQRDRLLIETHTNVVEMKRQIETLFKKLNGVDGRFREVDERCAKRGEVISGIKMRVVFMWLMLFAVFGAIATALVKMFFY
jgi:hypothetical protein